MLQEQDYKIRGFWGPCFLYSFVALKYSRAKKKYFDMYLTIISGSKQLKV